MNLFLFVRCLHNTNPKHICLLILYFLLLTAESSDFGGLLQMGKSRCFEDASTNATFVQSRLPKDFNLFTTTSVLSFASLKIFFLPKDTRQKRQPSTNRVCPAAPQDREPKSQGPLMANLLSTSLCASPSPLQGDGLHSKTQRGNKKKNLGQGGCLLAAALPKFRIAAPCTAAHNRGCGGWPGAPFMRTSHTSCVYLSSEPGFIARNLVLEHVYKLCLALAHSHGWP